MRVKKGGEIVRNVIFRLPARRLRGPGQKGDRGGFGKVRPVVLPGIPSLRPERPDRFREGMGRSRRLLWRLTRIKIVIDIGLIREY